MEYQSPHYRHFSKDLKELARRYELNPSNLTVEFYTPRHQAIVVEKLDNDEFQIHINLEENRIVSVKRLTENHNGNGVHIREKYRKYMK
jgi:hypothetical protein